MFGRLAGPILFPNATGFLPVGVTHELHHAAVEPFRRHPRRLDEPPAAGGHRLPARREYDSQGRLGQETDSADRQPAAAPRAGQIANRVVLPALHCPQAIIRFAPMTSRGLGPAVVRLTKKLR